MIDSQLLNVIFDTVIKWNAAFEVLEFRIGRTNEEPSFISMQITGPDESALDQVLEGLVGLGCRIRSSREVTLVRADKDGCVPNDFYSTTNHRTFVLHGGQWLQAEFQRMDAVIVIEDGRDICPSCGASRLVTRWSAASRVFTSCPNPANGTATASRS